MWDKLAGVLELDFWYKAKSKLVVYLTDLQKKITASNILDFDLYPHELYRIVSSILILMYVTGTHIQPVQLCITFVKCLWELGRANLSQPQPLRFSHPTIIMSSEKPYETNRIRKITGSFKGKLSSLLHLSRAPSLTIEMDSSSDNPSTR